MRAGGRWARLGRGALLMALALVLVCGLAGGARADVQRYAVVIGNDVGAADEGRLSYAESDARKVLEVLHSLGDFAPENTVLLLGRDADEVQRALISINARIRADTTGVRDAVLFVYYSGHADARALHLGGDALEVALLRRLVQGSSAAFRVLLLDACRSGALTRVKGARAVPPFDLAVQDQLSGEGVAFLTSSAADEDAQESDALRGSFFTHYFVSGLRGAADKNADGAVSVEEAYDYAYQHTLRASSRTLHGLQHPTFQFDLKGKGSIPLSWTRRAGGRSALLRIPVGRSYLLFADHADGAVVAEVDVADARREIALEPGKYFARGRGRDHLLEGSVELAAGETRLLHDADFDRVEYARLARKGGAERSHAHGVWLAYALRSPLWSGASACQGARGGYALDLPELTLGASLGACRSTFANTVLDARADEYSLHLSARRVLDIDWLALAAGLDTGVAWLRQSFDTLGTAPPRNSVAAYAGGLVSASADLSSGLHVLIELGAGLHVFEAQSSGADDLTAVFAWRPLLGAGKRF